MFTLDNINLHYPHALVERVPVCKDVFVNFESSGANLYSLEYILRWSTSLHCPQRMACGLEIQRAQGASYITWIYDCVSSGSERERDYWWLTNVQFNVNMLRYRLDQKCCW
jgi:hypothetical protein